MGKGFEHLSDAQLEQYGTDSFPGTSDDVSSIEAHLEDCDLCRSRVLEQQRVRFALLADASMKAPQTAGCVSEDDLRKLAAGIAPEDQALTMTKHAAQCSHCAPILRAFTEDFSDDLTPDQIKSENDMLAQLKSSTAKWQKNIASQAMKANHGSATASYRLDASTGSPSDSGSRSAGWLSRWILVPASLAAAAVIAFGVWYANRDTPEKVEKLLAQAYTEQRTMEYRWPGAEWGPVRVTRGAGQSHLSRPSSQLEAEKILAEHQGNNSSDPQWLTARAEAEMLDNEPQLAIADLTQALAANPGSSNIELMLAIAYAQQGDKLNDNASWEKALEFLDRILFRKIVADPATALFNRALVYRRLNMPEKAKADLDALLKWEHQPTWKPEDQKRGSESK